MLGEATKVIHASYEAAYCGRLAAVKCVVPLGRTNASGEGRRTRQNRHRQRLALRESQAAQNPAPQRSAEVFIGCGHLAKKHTDEFRDDPEFINLIRVYPDRAELLVARHQLDGRVGPRCVVAGFRVFDLEGPIFLYRV